MKMRVALVLVTIGIAGSGLSVKACPGGPCPPDPNQRALPADEGQPSPETEKQKETNPSADSKQQTTKEAAGESELLIGNQ
jgi:hypothetical protein